MNSTSTSGLKYASLETDLDVDEFCRNIVTEDGFFPNAALNLLKSIVKKCISNGIKDPNKIVTIINSDLDSIKDLLSNNNNVDFGFNLLENKSVFARNVLDLLRNYINDNSNRIV